MKIYLATNNKHKYEEFVEILNHSSLLLPAQEGIAFNPEETGNTFFENAMIKARSLYELVKTPVLADDSGLCVKALGGAPGIFSARYSTPPNSTENRADYGINKLLKEMEEKTERSAYFACCIVLYISESRFFVFQETCEGEIAKEKSGNKGFGYDPIFFIQKLGKTMAELTAEEKNQISHRGKALQKCSLILNSLANEL